MMSWLRVKSCVFMMYRLTGQGGGQIIAAPTAPAPAVAELADAAPAVADLAVALPDNETLAAMRWASKLDNDACVLSLLRSLPKEIVEEQVSLYRRREEPQSRPDPIISISPNARYHTRMLVASRFHLYCQARGIVPEKRMPFGAVKTFIQDNVNFLALQKIPNPIPPKMV